MSVGDFLGNAVFSFIPETRVPVQQTPRKFIPVRTVFSFSSSLATTTLLRAPGFSPSRPVSVVRRAEPEAPERTRQMKPDVYYAPRPGVSLRCFFFCRFRVHAGNTRITTIILNVNR